MAEGGKDVRAESGEVPGSVAGGAAKAVHQGDEERVVTALKALAHPVRLGIVRLLADKQAYDVNDPTCCGLDEVCVCRITEAFAVSAPTISHHLRLLREAGLIFGERRGVWIYYTLCREAMAEVADELSDLGGSGRRLERAPGTKGADSE
jgi:ArsR family transcriptional regulator